MVRWSVMDERVARLIDGFRSTAREVFYFRWRVRNPQGLTDTLEIEYLGEKHKLFEATFLAGMPTNFVL